MVMPMVLLHFKNSIQIGEEYTISCTSKSGDNNNKIKVQGFAFIINP